MIFKVQYLILVLTILLFSCIRNSSENVSDTSVSLNLDSTLIIDSLENLKIVKDHYSNNKVNKKISEKIIFIEKNSQENTSIYISSNVKKSFNEVNLTDSLNRITPAEDFLMRLVYYEITINYHFYSSKVQEYNLELNKIRTNHHALNWFLVNSKGTYYKPLKTWIKPVGADEAMFYDSDIPSAVILPLKIINDTVVQEKVIFKIPKDIEPKLIIYKGVEGYNWDKKNSIGFIIE